VADHRDRDPGGRFFIARDGVYAGNAGAISGACVAARHPDKRSDDSPAINGRYAGNAGAFSGGCLDVRYPLKPHPESPGNRVVARTINAIVNPSSRCIRNSLLMLRVEVLNFGAADSGSMT